MSEKIDSGLNVTGVLLILFIVLKLTNNIDWNWWWVLSPLWIPIAGVLAVVILMALIVGIMEAFKRW
jgi:membrane protein YdbS with pleckstrin-like domain